MQPSSSPITTSTVPTGTTSPSATRIRATFPAAGEGISTVVLSVWISTSGSSSATSCPSDDEPAGDLALGQALAEVGQLELVRHRLELVQQAPRRRRRPARPTACTRPRSASTDTARRSPSRAAPARAGRGSPSPRSSLPARRAKPARRGASCTITTRPVFATEASSVSSSSGFSDRTSSTSTDASERVRGRAPQTGTIAPYATIVRSVPSRASAHLAERDDVLALRHLAASGPVDELRLEDDDRIRIADRGGEQPLRVGRRRRDRHLHAGRVDVVRLGRVVVQLGRAHAAAVRHPHDERELHRAAAYASGSGRRG